MSTIHAKRFEAGFLCTHAYSPHLSYLAAAKVLKKSKHFVQMWVERFKDTKTGDDLPERGETRATSNKEDKAIIALFKRNPNLRLREAKAKLKKKGLHVSLNTIRRRLAETKVQYRTTRQKPFLSEVHMKKRFGKYRSWLVKCHFFWWSVLLGMGSHKTCLVWDRILETMTLDLACEKYLLSLFNLSF